jgi:hypothetical protein
MYCCMLLVLLILCKLVFSEMLCVLDSSANAVAFQNLAGQEYAALLTRLQVGA